MNPKWIITRIVTVLSYTQNKRLSSHSRVSTKTKQQENKTPKTLSRLSASCSLLRQVRIGEHPTLKVSRTWSRIWVKQTEIWRLPTNIQPHVLGHMLTSAIPRFVKPEGSDFHPVEYICHHYSTNMKHETHIVEWNDQNKNIWENNIRSQSKQNMQRVIYWVLKTGSGPYTPLCSNVSQINWLPEIRLCEIASFWIRYYMLLHCQIGQTLKHLMNIIVFKAT